MPGQPGFALRRTGARLRLRSAADPFHCPEDYERSRSCEYDYLPRLRPDERGNDAGGRMHILLDLPWLRHASETQAGRLLRFLQLRIRALPAGAAKPRLLRVT